MKNLSTICNLLKVIIVKITCLNLVFPRLEIKTLFQSSILPGAYIEIHITVACIDLFPLLRRLFQTSPVPQLVDKQQKTFKLTEKTQTS